LRPVLRPVLSGAVDGVVRDASGPGWRWSAVARARWRGRRPRLAPGGTRPRQPAADRSVGFKDPGDDRHRGDRQEKQPNPEEVPVQVPCHLDGAPRAKRDITCRRVVVVSTSAAGGDSVERTAGNSASESIVQSEIWVSGLPAVVLPQGSRRMNPTRHVGRGAGPRVLPLERPGQLEWMDGYGNRLGLIYVDFKTQERTSKLSAAWFREAARRNAVV
jgi:hypothetical protein